MTRPITSSGVRRNTWVTRIASIAGRAGPAGAIAAGAVGAFFIGKYGIDSYFDKKADEQRSRIAKEIERSNQESRDRAAQRKREAEGKLKEPKTSEKSRPEDAGKKRDGDTHRRHDPREDPGGDPDKVDARPKRHKSDYDEKSKSDQATEIREAQERDRRKIEGTSKSEQDEKTEWRKEHIDRPAPPHDAGRPSDAGGDSGKKDADK